LFLLFEVPPQDADFIMFIEITQMHPLIVFLLFMLLTFAIIFTAYKTGLVYKTKSLYLRIKKELYINSINCLLRYFAFAITTISVLSVFDELIIIYK